LSLGSNKTLSHKIGSFGQLPGDDDVIGMKIGYAETYSHRVTVSKKPTSTTQQIFFSFFANYKSSPSLKGFEQLSFSICVRVMDGQIPKTWILA